MRIGIDIDDTICDSWDTVIERMCSDFNKNLDDVIKSKKIYEHITDLSCDEYYSYVLKVFTKILKNTPLKANVKEVLNELSKNNEIYFITARLDVCFGDSYKYTKEYLDKNELPYNGVIVNALNKGKICYDLKIDLFIDDSIRNCEDVSNYGIDVIMFENYYNSDETKFKKVKNWNQILDIVRGNCNAGEIV